MIDDKEKIMLSGEQEAALELKYGNLPQHT